MQDLKKAYDQRLIDLFSKQLNDIEECRGYKVKRLVIERDEDWDIFFTIDSEIVSKSVQSEHK